MRSANLHYEERQPREERPGLVGRIGSRDDGYGSHAPHGHYMPQYGYERTAKESFMPPKPRDHSDYPPSTNYPSYPRDLQTRPPRGLQAVVTSSFSDDEAMRQRMMISEDRYESRERDHAMERGGVEEREASAYYRDYERQPMSQPPPTNRHHYIQKSYSTGYQVNDGPLKRSYFHHSHPSEGQSASGQLPADFMPPSMPPKRPKVGPHQSHGDIIISPRNNQADWYNRSSWEAGQDSYSKLNQRHSQSFPPPQHWSHQQHGPTDGPMRHGQDPEQLARSKLSSINESDAPSRAWRPVGASQWNGTSSRPTPSQNPQYRYWESKLDSAMEHSPHGSFDTPQQPYYASRSGSGDKMQLVMDAAAATGDHGPAFDNQGGLFLLALPQDRVSLSETLCIVRENIEVFTATHADVEAPAPGRKHAVVVGQVGLRCIHCRHTTKCSDRVKRAVCYPSSIQRIYRTVIDMKLDHFSQCKFVPENLKFKLQQLKSVQTRSTGTTMQYFIRAAVALGMEDGPAGVRLSHGGRRSDAEIENALSFNKPSADLKGVPTSFVINRTDSVGSGPSYASKGNESMMSTESFDSNSSPDTIVSLDKYYDGCIPLSILEDQNSLSPLRCFLRKQVCAFSATKEDIALRAPTTFSITEGQVGIGCIHCVSCPPKQRSNRAVCFPFSISRIYQSVADIQRFHFSECKNLPHDVKEKFLELQSASSKGSKGLATRQYWVTSARKIGLVDTHRGIRFGRDPTKPEPTKAFSLDILAEAAFSVTTAEKPIVVPDDKEEIAEFLYVVMEQLQPCRFTEADRNKRRLKDVGCIGVECKHCAGQVDSRKFFWSSVNAVESNFVSVHTHMLECRMVPDSLKEELVRLKSLRKEQTGALKIGSQKSFFARVWQRLHDDDASHNDAFVQETSAVPHDTKLQDEARDDVPTSKSNDTLEHEGNIVSI